MIFENGKAYIGHAGALTAVVRQSDSLGYWKITLIDDNGIRPPEWGAIAESKVKDILLWGGFSHPKAKWVWMPDRTLQLISADDESGNEGYVYFAYDPETHLIKIGFSRNPHRRCANFGKQCLLLAVYPGSIDKEKELHKKFAKYRQDGEWFRPARDQRHFIHSECFVLLDEEIIRGIWRRKRNGGESEMEDDSEQDEAQEHNSIVQNSVLTLS
jgi:hypothetical protein